MTENKKNVIDQQTATTNVDVDSHLLSSTTSLQSTSPFPSVQKSTSHKSKSWFNKLKSRIRGKDISMNSQDDTHVINQKRIDDNPNNHQLSSSTLNNRSDISSHPQISTEQNEGASTEEFDRITGK